MSEELLPNKLDMKEAAEFLKCSKSFIRTSTAKGTLTHYKIGNRYYYLKEDLLAMVNRVSSKFDEPHNDKHLIF